MTTKKKILNEARDYLMIAVAMMCYCIGWNIFLLPNEITSGGVTGVASVVYWASGIPVQWTYSTLNAILLVIALKILGWRFCVKTIWGVFMLTTLTVWVNSRTDGLLLLHDQPFMASIIGAIFCGTGVGLSFTHRGSTGGTDIIAAIVNKYREISLGRVIMLCDVIIVSSSYLVFHDWEKVIYGFVVLMVTSYCLDQVVQMQQRSVQFFIISDKYRDIATRVAVRPHRGATLIEAHGCYTGNEVNMLFIMCKRRESNIVMSIINEVDPKAFVTMTNVVGVYGEGFDKFKMRTPKHPKSSASTAELLQALDK